MENKKLLEEIRSYWNNRADGYSRVNQEELHSEQKEKWKEVLLEQLPKKEKDQVKILDIGTGPGFFAILLAEEGYQVTAVDYTEQMLEEAKNNAADLADQICFKRMDAQNLEFPEETFDYIVTRNVTWNLEHPKRAYREWKRVLKPGGKILNFDANWYAYLYDDKLKLGYEQDRQRAKEEQVEDYYEGTDIAWMENIAKQVPLSPLKRPKWDLDVLEDIGLDCWADETIGERVLSDAEKINYQSTPVFMVCAVKESQPSSKQMKKKPVIVCGDFNVAATELDIKNPKANVKNAGFTLEEREKFKTLLDSGFTDTYRYLHPDQIEYSWWSYRFKARERNAGWRIDYFLTSDFVQDKIRDARIHTGIMGSDHCPVELDIDL